LGTCATFIGAIPTFVVAINVSFEFPWCLKNNC
jgi:hypothetical protein